jgi:hypothetical protein
LSGAGWKETYSGKRRQREVYWIAFPYFLIKPMEVGLAGKSA